MLVTKDISFKRFMQFSGHHFLWLIPMAVIITSLYHYGIISFQIPWVPVSVIGTAVAFYVGFKNNQSYDRLWEARKIWGGIVNDSRTWGMMVDGFVSEMFTTETISTKELHAEKQTLIYRHIAWLYAHRNQLLIPTEWNTLRKVGI